MYSNWSRLFLIAIAPIFLTDVQSDPVRARAYVYKANEKITDLLENIGFFDFSQYGGYVKVIRSNVTGFIAVGGCTCHVNLEQINSFFLPESIILLRVNCAVVLQTNVPFSGKINGTVHGLPPGLHGFHVHEKGDLSNACVSAGAHFNPTQQVHGGQNDTIRHVGDLGNIYVPESRTVEISIEDSLIALHGPFSIIGRSIVIHEKEDDLGRGNSEASKTTGDSGARIACGVIGITGEADHPLAKPSTAKDSATSVEIKTKLYSAIILIYLWCFRAYFCNCYI